MADIGFEDVVKLYASKDGSSVVALDHVSFHVREEGFTSLLGPSGCGKSTCLRLATGLSRPTAGRVFVGGAEVRGPQTGFGMVFQSDVLLDWRNAIRNVLLPTEAAGFDATGAKEKAIDLLRSVGLGGFEERWPHELSGGMRQRVAICRALITDPSVLLMDEPFGAVDAITRDQLALDLQAVWEVQRPTVLFVTHSIAEAVFLSDEVVVMTPRPGRIERVVPIHLPRPRTLATRDLPEFGQYVHEIRETLLVSGALTERTVSNG